MIHLDTKVQNWSTKKFSIKSKDIVINENAINERCSRYDFHSWFIHLNFDQVLQIKLFQQFLYLKFDQNSNEQINCDSYIFNDCF